MDATGGATSATGAALEVLLLDVAIGISISIDSFFGELTAISTAACGLFCLPC